MRIIGIRKAVRSRVAARVAWRLTTGLACLLVTSCSSYKSMSVDEKRDLLAEVEEKTIAELVEKRPEVQEELDRSVGYAVFSNRATKIPVIGAGEGIGVVVNNETGDRSYLTFSRLDVGGGLGVREYRLIAIFFDSELLEKLAKGKYEFGAGLEAAVGSSEVSAEGSAGDTKEKSVKYQLSEKGVSATFTVRVAKYSVLDLGA
jgi:lipid-binding SYLF domain-containing protein